MGKPTICICENKDADQLRGNREADQRLCFRYMDSTIPLLPKIQNFIAVFCYCAVRFVSDLVGNHNSYIGFPTIHYMHWNKGDWWGGGGGSASVLRNSVRGLHLIF